MTVMFVGDIEKGVGDTGLRAGILKYATDQYGVTNWHIHDDVIPALRQRVVTDEQSHTMLVENPRKCFEKQGAY